MKTDISLALIDHKNKDLVEKVY